MSSVANKQGKNDQFLSETWEAVMYIAGLALFVITLVGMMEMVTIRHPPEHTLQATQEGGLDEQQQLPIAAR